MRAQGTWAVSRPVQVVDLADDDRGEPMPVAAALAMEAAADAYKRALDLCQNPVERAYLQRRLDEMLDLLA